MNNSRFLYTCVYRIIERVLLKRTLDELNKTAFKNDTKEVNLEINCFFYNSKND